LMGTIATPLQAMLGPFASQLPITPFNLVCTNVPGPQFPLYLLGHKMLKWYPYVPVGGEMTLNCAILSYNGAVYFGFSGCSQAAPDLGRVVSLLKASATELCRATGIKSSRPERTIAKRKSSQKPKKVAKTQVPVPFPTGPPALEPVAMASPTIPTNATTVAAVPLHS